MKLTPSQAQTYFEVRLSGQKFARSGENLMARCVFHDDRRASLSVNPEKNGAWKCFAGCGQGSVVDFEKRFSNCDSETATANVAQICGLADQRLFQQKPEATYAYRDEDHNVQSEKLRYPGKRFVQRAPGPNGEWIYKLDGIRRVLYNLPEVVTASDVVIAEGEKDCDNVTALNLACFDKSTRFATTTNFDGAGKWKSDYSPFFAGKRVVILPDNDPPGEAHAEQVAGSILPYARSVRIVKLPGLAPKGDVSDYLQSHTAEQLLAEILRTPLWKPAADKLLVQAPQFLTAISSEIDWLVRGVIQRGANGFIAGLPKSGKSWNAVDLAIALALGLPWLGFEVPRAAKTALITREDNPALTKWRMRHLLEGRNRTIAELEDYLYVNSREQSPEFRVDQPELIAPMIAELKAVRPEFVILDVFNVLHGFDEDKNTEMRIVLELCSRIQNEVGCQLGIVHHFSKHGEGSLTQRLRGAGAIAGWAEWAVGIEKIPGEQNTRKIEFELKAAAPPDSFHFAIRTDEACGSISIERVDFVPEKTSRRHKAEDFVQ